MIREYFISQGWKPYEDGFIDRHWERYVDLSADFGVWELKVFTGGDIDGVAVARFVNECEGDTLAELSRAPRCRANRNYPRPQRTDIASCLPAWRS
jgi:hypothetical protein